MCQFSFKQQSNLSKHLLTAHTTQRPFSCRFCNKAFAVKSNLNDHEKVHTNDRQFPCLLCSKRFITAAALRAHASHHISCKTSELAQSLSLVFSDNSYSVTSERLTCDTCNKEFSSIAALSQHDAVHSSVRSFECKTCGKCFKYASNLYAHRRLHQRKEVDIVKLQTAPSHWVTCEVQIPSVSDPYKNSSVLPDVLYQ